jgi:hypothetical protein
MIPIAPNAPHGEGVPIWFGFERAISGLRLLRIPVSCDRLCCTRSRALMRQSRMAGVGQQQPIGYRKCLPQSGHSKTFERHSVRWRLQAQLTGHRIHSFELGNDSTVKQNQDYPNIPQFNHLYSVFYAEK